MPFESGAHQPYSMSFTAASLRPELARILAEVFLSCGDWDETKKKVLADNALQARSPASGIRMEREIRQRLQTLSRSQIEILANAPADSRSAIAWLSVLKHEPFVFVFAAEVLRGKIEALDPVLRPSDYEQFVAGQATDHPELSRLTPTTKAKIRQVTIRMLREVGILGDDAKDFTLRRPVIPADVLAALVQDDPWWLAGFLVPDHEIATLRG